jgi:divalent metal cation (Fe/Co/Zn/Cd) transporter
MKKSGKDINYYADLIFGLAIILSLILMLYIVYPNNLLLIPGILILVSILYIIFKLFRKKF